MNRDEKIQILQILTELALKEAELIWTRYTTMLYASTGLVAILSFAAEKDLKFISFGTALIGLILAGV